MGLSTYGWGAGKKFSKLSAPFDARLRRRLSRRHVCRRKVDGLKSQLSLSGSDLRVAVIHQDHARESPEQEHHSDPDAQPSMRINEKLAPIEQFADVHVAFPWTILRINYINSPKAGGFGDNLPVKAR